MSLSFAQAQASLAALRPGERFEPLRLPPCEWCASDLPIGLFRCPHCGGPRSVDAIRVERDIRLSSGPMPLIEVTTLLDVERVFIPQLQPPLR